MRTQSWPLIYEFENVSSLMARIFFCENSLFHKNFLFCIFRNMLVLYRFLTKLLIATVEGLKSRLHLWNLRLQKPDLTPNNSMKCSEVCLEPGKLTGCEYICKATYVAGFLNSRYIHIHADPWSSSLTVHNGHGGDDVHQGSCQPAVQRPTAVCVLLFHPHLAHHLPGACRHKIHLRTTPRISI